MLNIFRWQLDGQIWVRFHHVSWQLLSLLPMVCETSCRLVFFLSIFEKKRWDFGCRALLCTKGEVRSWAESMDSSAGLLFYHSLTYFFSFLSRLSLWFAFATVSDCLSGHFDPILHCWMSQLGERWVIKLLANVPCFLALFCSIGHKSLI